jgi:hypothetical protein
VPLSLFVRFGNVLGLVIEYVIYVTTQARQEIRTRRGLTLEAYGSAWENRNLRLINTYRSCTKGLQKTAYLHLGNSLLKYTKEGELS